VEGEGNGEGEVLIVGGVKRSVEEMIRERS
jgi:hypothetical protein